MKQVKFNVRNNTVKHFQGVPKILGLLGGIGLLVSSVAMPGWSGKVDARSMLEAEETNKIFIPDGGGGRPKRKLQAGSRGPCNGAPGQSVAGDASLVALTPEYREQAKTTEAYPTLWFHIPFQASDVHALQFELWEDKDGGADLYQRTPIQLTSSVPGMVGITLPSSGPGLVTGQSYSGLVVVRCGPNPTDQSSALEFSVTRVERSGALETALQGAASPYDQAVAFANNGIWFEALTIVGNGLQQQPSNGLLQDAWTELLGDVGLEDVAGGSIANCCSLSQ